ncbi:MAG: flagellar hook-associated protein FlgK [Epulopiscium sp. Nele67-Bin005]|nr:MAG: flagellar hook-associated protein FlgK [Epulopiscium sp. Nele67-Bin005]
MSSIASLGRAVSGLVAAQQGLEVTAHNISNLNTAGYTRQQLLQSDSSYVSVGKNGGYSMLIGNGVDCVEIRQIRDDFTDKRFRTENSVLSYYQVQSDAISEIETILNEPYGNSISSLLDSFWGQAQKLAMNPSGVEERMTFIQSAVVLLDRVEQIQDSLHTYQDYLNNQVISAVGTINDLVLGIREANQLIAAAEINGDNANDYRDARNLMLDELSTYLDITCYEDALGQVSIHVEGRVLLDEHFVNTIGLQQTEPMSPYMNPIWENTGEEVFRLTTAVTSTSGNDTGGLKAMIIARGLSPADATTSWSDITLNDYQSVDVAGNSYTIPEIQKKLDTFMTELATMINESLDGYGIGIAEGSAGVPLFIPITNIPAYPTAISDDPNDENYIDPDSPEYAVALATYNAEMENYRESIGAYLTTGNIQVNPELLADAGYNKLGTVSQDGDISDSSKVEDMLASWGDDRDWYETYLVDDDGNIMYDENGDPIKDPNAPILKSVNFADFYAELVAEIGQSGSNYSAKVSEKYVILDSITNERWSMSAVSQDEELATLMKYQYAYQAAARVVNILDGMMDTIINHM